MKKIIIPTVITLLLSISSANHALANTCTTESDYQALQTQLINNGSSRYSGDISNGILSACRDAINQNQTQNNYLQSNSSSGACSYHGGVNCSAGANLDGGVTCNDGWTDSSVSYSSVKECSSTESLPCPRPYTNECIANAYNLACLERDLHSQYNKSTNNCECSQGYSEIAGTCQSPSVAPVQQSNLIDAVTHLNEVCKADYGQHSVYMTNSNECFCEQGYQFDSSNKCVLVPLTLASTTMQTKSSLVEPKKPSVSNKTPTLNTKIITANPSAPLDSVSATNTASNNEILNNKTTTGNKSFFGKIWDFIKSIF